MAASPFAVLPTSSTSRQIWRFGLLCVAFALLWAICSAYGIGNESPLDTILCNQLAAASAWGLRAMGWAASTGATRPDLLVINGYPSVYVGAACDGLVLYALLAGFVLAYPGPTRRRLWFIPMGIIALWLLNVIRIIALALNFQYSPETFEFDHHYAFSAVAYAVLGGLWLLWTRQGNSGIAPATAGLVAENASPNTLPVERSWLTVRVVVGVALVLALALVSIYQNQATAALSAGWAAILAAGPAWLQRLPGAIAGNGDVPANVSRLALPVGAAYLGLLLTAALLALRLLLPDRNWRLAWRCYAGLGLGSAVLFLAGKLGGGPAIYHLGRMLLDFMVSLLPIAGLLVLLWRPVPTAETVAVAASE